MIQSEKGHSNATVSLILGIIATGISIAMFTWTVLFVFAAPVAVICGVIGIIFAHMAKTRGDQSSTRTAGLVCYQSSESFRLH